MERSQSDRDQMAAVFAEADVANSYAARPPYAPALFDHLLARVPARRRLLDIGCGPGTIAIPMADHFAEVVALDPSAPMIEAGIAADVGRHPNIVWMQARAEELDPATQGDFDLVTAGTAIHWPDHALLFPKLVACTSRLAVLNNAATVVGWDEAAALDLLKRWLEIMAARTPGVRGTYDPVAFAAEGRRHERWVDIDETCTFEHLFRQRVDAYVDAQHSTATFSRAAMGEALTAEYDAELAAMLCGVAEDGWVELACTSTLTIGRPRATPKP